MHKVGGVRASNRGVHSSFAYKKAALIPFAEVRFSFESEWVREKFLEWLGREQVVAVWGNNLGLKWELL